MRIIEYAPRKLNQYGYVYTVSNAYIRAEDGTVLDVTKDNIRSPGIKMKIEKIDIRKHHGSIHSFIDSIGFFSEAEKNLDFMNNYKAALLGERSEWKIVTFQPAILGLKVFMANERLYNNYWDNDQEDLDYSETLLLHYDKIGNTCLRFEVERPGGLGINSYSVTISSSNVSIAEFTDTGTTEFKFTGIKSEDPFEPDQMFVQETGYIM